MAGRLALTGQCLSGAQLVSYAACVRYVDAAFGGTRQPNAAWLPLRQTTTASDGAGQAAAAQKSRKRPLKPRICRANAPFAPAAEGPKTVIPLFYLNLHEIPHTARATLLRAGTRLRETQREPLPRRRQLLPAGARRTERPYERSRGPPAHDAGQRQLPVACAPSKEAGCRSSRQRGNGCPRCRPAARHAAATGARGSRRGTRAAARPSVRRSIARRDRPVDDQLGTPVGHHAREPGQMPPAAGDRPHAFDAGPERRRWPALAVRQGSMTRPSARPTSGRSRPSSSSTAR